MNRARLVLSLTALVLFAALVSSCLTMVLLVKTKPDVVAYKMAEVNRVLDTYFIDDYDREQLEAAAADGAAAAMVAATEDPWSYYIPADQMPEYEEQMANAYVGVGITISVTDGNIKIIELAPGGPAQLAGLKVDDVLIAVDGTDVSDLDVNTVASMVGGEAGTSVTLTVSRGEEVLQQEMVRAEIQVPVAEAEMLQDQIGLVTIANFDANCARETLECIHTLLKQGAKALIFDVRFNGGGYKDEMVQILDALLPEGVLFRSEDYAGRKETIHSDAEHLDVPMAVLVNEDTYSAAEFFAAALQEYDAAQIVGTQTTGKGRFQYTLKLSDGSAVVLSSGRYMTPGQKDLTNTGVVPNVVVELTDADYYLLYEHALNRVDDEQLMAAVAAVMTKIS